MTQPLLLLLAIKTLKERFVACVRKLVDVVVVAGEVFIVKVNFLMNFQIAAF